MLAGGRSRWGDVLLRLRGAWDVCSRPFHAGYPMDITSGPHVSSGRRWLIKVQWLRPGGRLVLSRKSGLKVLQKNALMNIGCWYCCMRDIETSALEVESRKFPEILSAKHQDPTVRIRRQWICTWCRLSDNLQPGFHVNKLEQLVTRYAI